MCQEILRIADLLSAHHPAVRAEMAECVEDPAQYGRKHEAEYPAFQDFGDAVDETDLCCVQWIVLTQCLIQHGIAADLDWKCELEDFLDAMKTCAAVENGKLPLKREWFDEEASVEDWCNTLNEKWESSHFTVVELSTYGDNYVILPVPADAAEYLRQWAVQTESGILQLIHPGLSENPQELSAFFQRHPCAHAEESDEDNLADQCKIWRAHGEWGWRPAAMRGQQQPALSDHHKPSGLKCKAASDHQPRLPFERSTNEKAPFRRKKRLGEKSLDRHADPHGPAGAQRDCLLGIALQTQLPGVSRVQQKTGGY